MKRLLFICFLLSAITARAVTLPSVIASNMVLQQKSQVKLWGWGSTTEKIYITNSWNGKTDSTVVDGNAKWQLEIATPSAGGPYTITVKGNNTILLENVLIGEVWICSGQSNMEFNFYAGIAQIREEFADAHKLNLRFFTVPRTTAEFPQDDVKGQWAVSDSQTLKSFSAVAYYFGKRLNQDLNVPIGLINASWGGTPAEPWTPLEVVSSDSVLSNAARQQNVTPWWPISPGYAYNGMLAPLTKFAVAGAIWYQGESNVGTAATYEQLFTKMISSWREQWNIDFPFYFVQLAPFKYGNKHVAALLREAQHRSLRLPKTGMVVTVDLADDTLDIHPKNKKDVGFRLANLALTENYGKPVTRARSPFFKVMEVQKEKAIISFDESEALVIKKAAIPTLYIAGEDQVFYPAQSSVKGDKLVLWSKLVKHPVAVRYAFGNTAVGNIFTAAGMPVAPFRTDAWAVDTSPVNAK